MNLIYFLLLTVNVNAISQKSILRSMLLQNYTKTERPVYNDEDIVKVAVSLDILNMMELDIHRGLLTSKLMIGLSWKDIYLLWNKAMKNITYISVNVEDIWYPTVSICNDMSGKFSMHEGEGATVKYDGSVSFHMDGIFQTYCTINMLKYPFDEHECNITVCLGHQDYIEKNIQRFSFHNLHKAAGDQWEYKFAVGNVTEEEIISATVTVFAKRKFMSESLTYFIFPIMLTILNLGVYLLPAQSGEKVSVAITIFLANVVYLTETAKLLGTRSLGISRYLWYLLILTFVSCFSTLISIIVCKMYVNQATVKNNSISELRFKETGSKNKIGIIDPSYESKLNLKTTIHPKKHRYNFQKLDMVFFFGTVIFLLICIIIVVLPSF